MEWNKQYKEAIARLGEGSDKLKAFRKVSRHFFETALLANKVALGNSGPDFDAERQPIDTIIIHHTSGPPGYRLSYMNAVQLLNIYAAYYAQPAAEDKNLKGQAVWSGHSRGGKPSFLVYHWLMRMDGSFERLLKDEQIGWHAGNWHINKRSIAICLDNDYEKQDPDAQILKKLATHIKKNYPNIKASKIIGHCEARQGTTCPGTNWLQGWKPQLIKLLNDHA